MIMRTEIDVLKQVVAVCVGGKETLTFLYTQYCTTAYVRRQINILVEIFESHEYINRMGKKYSI